MHDQQDSAFPSGVSTPAVASFEGAIPTLKRPCKPPSAHILRTVCGRLAFRASAIIMVRSLQPQLHGLHPVRSDTFKPHSSLKPIKS